MAKVRDNAEAAERKPLIWLHGEIMNPAQRKALQAAGWKVGDAAEFLDMSDGERQLLDARVELALAIRRQREASHLSQKELGIKLKTSQPRVARIERAAADVSLDQLVRTFAAVGGTFVVKVAAAKSSAGKKSAKGKRPLKAPASR